MEKIVKAPRDCSPTEQELFQDFVIEGGEVSSGRLRNRIQRAEHLCFINDGDCVVAVGAIKNPDDGYKTRIFEKAGVPSPSNYSYELGWLFVLTSERKKGYGRALMEALMGSLSGKACYATTREDNNDTHLLLGRFGFSRCGQSYKSDNGDYDLVLYTKS
jgi:predicted GNAT family N-acyltransferase